MGAAVCQTTTKQYAVRHGKTRHGTARHGIRTHPRLWNVGKDPLRGALDASPLRIVVEGPDLAGGAVGKVGPGAVGAEGRAGFWGGIG